MELWVENVGLTVIQEAAVARKNTSALVNIKLSKKYNRDTGSDCSQENTSALVRIRLSPSNNHTPGDNTVESQYLTVLTQGADPEGETHTESGCYFKSQENTYTMITIVIFPTSDTNVSSNRLSINY